MPSRFAEFQRQAAEQCIPLNVTLEITLRCNLRCVHCYNFDRDLPYLPGRNRQEELTDAEIHRILDEVREAGCLFLAFTGGEALVHPGLEDFIRHGSRSGMRVRVKSNGTLLGPEAAARLARAGAEAVDVSLYGAEAPTHDRFVGMPGAFERTLKGTRAALDAGLQVRFAFVVGRHNADQIGRMIEMSTAMGVPYHIDPQMTARYDGSTSSLDLCVDRETLERLYRGPMRSLVPAAVENPVSVQCLCARTVCGISAFGEVYPCIGAPVPSGNLRERSFGDVWRNSPVFAWIRGLRLDDFPACRVCDHRAHCRRSSGVLYTNTGVYTGPERFGDDLTCVEAEILHAIHDEAPAAEDAGRTLGTLRRHSLD